MRIDFNTSKEHILTLVAQIDNRRIAHEWEGFDHLKAFSQRIKESTTELEVERLLLELTNDLGQDTLLGQITTSWLFWWRIQMANREIAFKWTRPQ